MAERGEGGKGICDEGTAEHSGRRGGDDGSSGGGLDGLNWGCAGDGSEGSSGGGVDVLSKGGEESAMLPKKEDDLTQGSREDGKMRSGGVEVGVDMRQSRVEPSEGGQSTPDYGHVTGAEVSGGYGGSPAGKRSEGSVAHALRGNVSTRRPQLEGKKGVG